MSLSAFCFVSVRILSRWAAQLNVGIVNAQIFVRVSVGVIERDFIAVNLDLFNPVFHHINHALDSTLLLPSL